MTAFDRNLTPNVQARAWNAPRWATWFVSALWKNDVAPFRFHPDANIIDEIDLLFIAADEPTRRRMRDGIVQALHEWHIEFYDGDHHLLRLLARTAARIRATDVVPHLVRFIMANYANVASGNPPFFTVADDVISVIAAFAPDPRVEHLFDLMLFDDDVTPKLAGLLAVGLCRCQPSRFADCFERFWTRRNLAPRFFVDRHIIAQFEKVVTPAEMTRSITALHLGAQEYFFHNGAEARKLGPKELVGFHTPNPEDVRGLPVAFKTDRELFRQTTIRYEVAADVSSRVGPGGKWRKIRSAVSRTDDILGGMMDHAGTAVTLQAGAA